MNLQKNGNSRAKNAKAREIGKHLQVHPNMCFGRLTFKGTRVPVEVVLAYVANGLSIDDVGKHWPGVSREAAEEAVQLAAMALIDLTRARPWKPEEYPPRPWKKRGRPRGTSKKVPVE